VVMRICLSILLFSIASGGMASLYIGGGVGTVDYGLEDVTSFDDSTGFELIVGNRINSNLSIEASYIEFGKASDGIPPEWRIDINTVTFGALIIAPVAPQFDVFVKLGLHMWAGDVREDGFGIIAKDDGTDIFYGFGAAMNVNRQVTFGVRYNVYSYKLEGAEDDAKMLLFNILVGF
jgi:Outer membrane protein beta-barrel domain